MSYAILSKKKKKIAPFVYGDKTKKKGFFLCENCDVRYLFPVLIKNKKNFFTNGIRKIYGSKEWQIFWIGSKQKTTY